MANPAIDIPNLLYRYAEAFDDGDFEGAAHLFDRGSLIAGGQPVKGVEAIVAMWRSWVKLYDGKPRTRHITTNPIIELADDGQSATCRSQWTVLQATDDFAMQLVASGRYDDRFAVIDGKWRFTERRYGQVDLVGDTGAHMKRTLATEET
ncbi:MAG: nuclear transport factor 2 family protein [Sphingomonadaceae bacterium]